jgi:hypothetical protein
MLVPGAWGRAERRSLFNGKDLDGWTVVEKGRWSVQFDDENKNGKRDRGEPMCIVGEQDPDAKAESWLLSNEEFADFSLTAAVRTSKGGNSGLFLRVPQDVGKHAAYSGYEIQLWDADEENPTGSVYGAAKAPKGLHQVGKWNAITVTAIGKRLVVAVNSKLAVDVESERSLRGRIGFQVHGGDQYAGMKVEISSISVFPLTTFLPDTPSPVAFKIHQVDNGRSEGCQVFDINKDGQLDITCGPRWYEGPRWTPHDFRYVKPQGNFMNDYGECAIDVDSDGWTDIVSGGWFANEKGENWFASYRNPGAKGGKWAETVIDREKLFIETLLMADVDGDGDAGEFITDCPQAAWYGRVGKGDAAKIVRHNIGKQGVSHGLGFGDLDGDGRGDLVRPDGFYRGPKDPRTDEWEWCPEFDIGHTGIPCPVHDLNGDGSADVIYGQGHDFGLYWLEQGRSGGKRTWTNHAIDQTSSQTHTITLADLDGDGDLDIVTGKRYHGHGGADPGAWDGVTVVWYEVSPGPTFKKHVISYNEGVGVGMQVPILDIDKDGDLDLVCPGQTGLYVLENLTK